MSEISFTKKIKYPEYEKGVDYFKLFCDTETKLVGYTYLVADPLAVWGGLFRPPHNKQVDDALFYKMYCGNLYKTYKQKNHNVDNHLRQMKLLNQDDDQEKLWAFVTLGFDDQKITPQSMLAVSKLVFDKPFVMSGSSMVLERHRRDKQTGETRIHHHVHILIHFSEKIPPSRIIDEIFKTKGIKSVMRDKNMVDYVGPQKPKKHFCGYQVYHNYVRGVKCNEKMPYVEMDGKWRSEHGIPDLFEK